MMNIGGRIRIETALALSFFFIHSPFACPEPSANGQYSSSSGVDRPVTPDENRAAVDKLREAIDRWYSYRDLRKVNWDLQFKAYRPRMERAKTALEFANRASEMLAHAHDPHIYLKAGSQAVAAGSLKIYRNYNPPLLAKLVPGFQKKNASVYTGKFGDDIGYILITTWGHNTKGNLSAVYEAIKSFSQTKALIIDVRPNGGGDERLARSVAGCFVEKPVVYSKNFNCTGEPDGKFAGPYDRVLQPNPDVPRYQGKVAVLMGQACMSSCESFLLMMKQVPGCTLIGEKSRGSSGNPKPHDLGNGVTVFLPSWKDLRPDGTCLEGEGVAPDLKVKTTAADLRRRDPVIEAAVKYLRKP